MSDLPRLLVTVGVILIAIGIGLSLFHNKFDWLFHLPGDIVIKKRNFQFYFPIVTMLLVSGMLTLIMWIVNRFFD